MGHAGQLAPCLSSATLLHPPTPRAPQPIFFKAPGSPCSESSSPSQSSSSPSASMWGEEGGASRALKRPTFRRRTLRGCFLYLLTVFAAPKRVCAVVGRTMLRDALALAACGVGSSHLVTNGSCGPQRATHQAPHPALHAVAQAHMLHDDASQGGACIDARWLGVRTRWQYDGQRSGGGCSALHVRRWLHGRGPHGLWRSGDDGLFGGWGGEQ